VKVTITFANPAKNVTIEPVRALEVVGPGTLQTATHGNGPVVHRGVLSFTVEPFDFPRESTDADAIELMRSKALARIRNRIELNWTPGPYMVIDAFGRVVWRLLQRDDAEEFAAVAGFGMKALPMTPEVASSNFKWNGAPVVATEATRR
jgi:hypothetical protein